MGSILLSKRAVKTDPGHTLAYCWGELPTTLSRH